MDEMIFLSIQSLAILPVSDQSDSQNDHVDHRVRFLWMYADKLNVSTFYCRQINPNYKKNLQGNPESEIRRSVSVKSSFLIINPVGSRVNVGGKNEDKEDDQQPGCYYTGCRYQQPNRGSYFYNSCCINDFFFIRNKGWKHHGHSFGKKKMSCRSKQ